MKFFTKEEIEKAEKMSPLDAWVSLIFWMYGILIIVVGGVMVLFALLGMIL